MANYYSKTRTNMFKVLDEKRYKEIVGNLICDGRIFSENVGKDGETYHFIAADGNLEYVDPESDDEDLDLNLFLKELQKILPDDQVVIIEEVGSEALRYLVGYVIVLTSKEVRSMSLDQWANDAAKEMLQIS